VTVTSTTDPAGISVTLHETAADSATFTGDVTLVVLNQGQVPGPGQLAVRKSDTIRLAYADPDDGAGRAYEAFDTAKVEDPSVTLLNPPDLVDPGDTDADGTFTLDWSAAEESNNRGLSRTIAYYIVEESTDYTVSLFDDAEGELATNWTTETATQFSLPWVDSPAFNRTPSAPAPGESYWSQGVESGANALDVDTRLVLNRDVTIPATVGTARLTFYSRYFNEPDDLGTVEVSTDAGTTWTELLRIADAPQTPPADTRMQHHEVDLTAYRGQPLRVRFRFVSTSNYYLFVTAGWWVDDVTASGATWRRVAIVPPDQTQAEIAGRFDGRYFYRVQAVYTDGTASTFGNVEEIDVDGPGAAPAGRAGTLTLAKSGSDLQLDWGASCLTSDADYEVYEGEIGDFTSHEQRMCSTSSALTATLTPDEGNRYYLVVPHNGTSEGSYGSDSEGAERPQGGSSCRARTLGTCP
jgi:hypothetical protein